MRSCIILSRSHFNLCLNHGAGFLAGAAEQKKADLYAVRHDNPALSPTSSKPCLKKRLVSPSHILSAHFFLCSSGPTTLMFVFSGCFGLMVEPGSRLGHYPDQYKTNSRGPPVKTMIRAWSMGGDSWDLRWNLKTLNCRLHSLTLEWFAGCLILYFIVKCTGLSIDCSLDVNTFLCLTFKKVLLLWSMSVNSLK